MSRLDRITIRPGLCHGQPTIRSMRLPVSSLLALLASGMTREEILEDYPDIERDDIVAALEFGSLTGGRVRTIPLDTV